MKARRYAVEWRKPSKRTPSGWTAWDVWTTHHHRVDAERAAAAYKDFGSFEFRIIDRREAE